MYHTTFQKKNKEQETKYADKLEKGFFSAREKAIKKYKGYLPPNLEAFFEFEAHRIGIPHQCPNEDMSSAFHLAMVDSDFNRQEAESKFF